MKYKFSNIAVGILLLLIGLVRDFGFSNAEQIGISIINLVLIFSGIYFVYGGVKSGIKKDLSTTGFIGALFWRICGVLFITGFLYLIVKIFFAE